MRGEQQGEADAGAGDDEPGVGGEDVDGEEFDLEGGVGAVSELAGLPVEASRGDVAAVGAAVGGGGGPPGGAFDLDAAHGSGVLNDEVWENCEL